MGSIFVTRSKKTNRPQRRNSAIARVSALSVKVNTFTQVLDFKHVFGAKVVPAELPAR
jgi:hypothetical protein